MLQGYRKLEIRNQLKEMQVNYCAGFTYEVAREISATKHRREIKALCWQKET
jgi:hypothetical protein